MIEYSYLLVHFLGSVLLAKKLPQNPTQKQYFKAALIMPVIVFGVLSYPRVLITQDARLLTQLIVLILGTVVSYATLRLSR